MMTIIRKKKNTTTRKYRGINLSAPVFNDFYKHLGSVDKTNYQLPVASKKKPKYTMPLTLVGTAAGIIQPSLKVSKNTNLQYAVFVKEKLKPIMTPEFDQAHKHQCIPKFSKNPITHIKQIKESIKYYDEDIFSYQESLSKSQNKLELEKEMINIKKKKLQLQQFLAEYKYIFKDINLQFREKMRERFMKKAIIGILIWSTIGTLVGMALDKITKKCSNKK